MQKKKWGAIAAILALVAALAVIWLLTPRNDSSAIKIGVTLPLSGDAAPYGKEGLNGLRLAAEEINAKGGINGQKIELLVEDDRGTAKDGVSALQKLLATNSDMQVVIGGAFSQIAAAQIPICEAKGIVLFSPYASNPDLSKPGDCFFRNWPSDTAEGSEMGKYARQKLGLARIAILASRSDYGLGLKQVFAKEFKRLGGTVPVSETFKESDTDFRAQLTKIKAAKPDGIYLIGWYKEYAQILRQARELGITVQFLSCVTFNKPELLKLAGDTAEGVIFTQPAYSTESQDPAVKRFVAAYKAKFGVAPGTYAAQGYDALHLLAEAGQKGVIARDIKNGLYAIRDFPGVTGTTTFDANGDVQKHVEFYAVRSGRYVPVQD